MNLYDAMRKNMREDDEVDFDCADAAREASRNEFLLRCAQNVERTLAELLRLKREIEEHLSVEGDALEDDDAEA